MIYYFGYNELEGKERIELYDVEADSEETNSLIFSLKGKADEMLNEIKEKLTEADKFYS